MTTDEERLPPDGWPGSGKTRLVSDVISKLGDRAGGFNTEEIRSDGARLGFRLITPDGQSAIFAHVGIRGGSRIGEYGVDVDALDSVGGPAIERAVQSPSLVVVDEIGKMELLSLRLREVVSQAIISGRTLLAAISLDSHPFADSIKNMPCVNLVTVTRGSYDAVLGKLLIWSRATGH